MNPKKLDDLKQAQSHIRELRKLYLKYPDLLPEIDASVLIKLSDAIKTAKNVAVRRP
jgi:hypothetical protein